MHIQDQKGKNLNINQFSENKRNTFHLSKNGIQNPLIKKNEENELDMDKNYILKKILLNI